jgi:Ni,Fe-hydrogenase III large subunit
MNATSQVTTIPGHLGAKPAGEPSRRRFTIDPITRLEGHGKIEIFLDAQGDVDRAYLQIPELRGCEVFSIGRPAEDMPQITSRICGVCPTAHHMAATKALDDLYQVQPPPAAAYSSIASSRTVRIPLINSSGVLPFEAFPDSCCH